MSSLELHLHLGTAWSRFRPRAEWGAGWGQWRLFLLAGCSAPRKKERGSKALGTTGCGVGPQRLALPLGRTDPGLQGEMEGSWEEAPLGGLGEGFHLLSHSSTPRVLHLSAFHVPHLWALPWPPWSARAGAGCWWTVEAESSLGACKQVEKLPSASVERKWAVVSQELWGGGGSFSRSRQSGACPEEHPLSPEPV